MQAIDSVTGLSTTGGRDRIRAFDLARGLAILFMIGVHVLWHWGAPETWGTPVGVAISLLGGPTAAPTFMFLMGASLAFSRRTDTASLVRRGIWLVVLGYILNVLRGVIPATLGLAAGVVTQDEILPFTPAWLLTSVDIHHMAGLSLITIGLLRARSAPGPAWLVLGAAVVLAAPTLRGLQFGTPWLDGPLTPILGSAPNVFYALVPWVVYPLAGAAFGRILAASGDRSRTFRRGAVLGAGLLVGGGALLSWQRPVFDVATYWREPVSYVVGIMGLVLVWLALCDAVARRPWIDRRLGIVYGWSARVIPMYFTHWIVVGWGIGIVGFRDLGLAAVLGAIAAATAVTHVASGVTARLEGFRS